ncbi:Ribonuclease H-like domain containing protein [Parasponia andersonii]|uniref:Ribonuclease H-like domain containing protein n=1 Tax=Parasponia andersonii TaxID=3476 RepID=A0A2P5BPG9_PARAD|nr:Ribonuclease H-like domain containing protein [Parasponia andersonii]
MHSPMECHMEDFQSILGYLKLHREKGCCSRKMITSVTNRKSTSSYCTFVGENLVTWRNKKQNVVVRSSTEAKYRAMAQGICEVLWIQMLLKELKLEPSIPMKVFCDNKAAISITYNPVQHDRTKHVEVDQHFIKEKIENGQITTHFVTSHQQIVDVLTKGILVATSEDLVCKLGICDIYSPT